MQFEVLSTAKKINILNASSEAPHVQSVISQFAFELNFNKYGNLYFYGFQKLEYVTLQNIIRVYMIVDEDADVETILNTIQELFDDLMLLSKGGW